MTFSFDEVNVYGLPGGDWRIARETAGVKSLLAVVVSRIEHVLRESPCLSPKLKTAGDNSESNALIAADWI
jgi:hypothetical protein